MAKSPGEEKPQCVAPAARQSKGRLTLQKMGRSAKGAENELSMKQKLMRTLKQTVGWTMAVWLLVALGATCQAGEKLRLLVVAGGHRFETNQYWQVFKDNPEVTLTTAIQPEAQAQWRPENAKNYDVLVLYDYWQKYTEEAKADLVAWLKAGKGVLIMHHAIADFQQWPEYDKILGAHYYLMKTNINGVLKPRSRAKEGADIHAEVADKAHPVTRGLKDFDIHDETYFGYDLQPDSHLLLTTQNTNNAPSLAWCRTYESARVVYVQLGHDHFAYENPNFRKLVAQAIRWVGKKD